MAEKPNAIMMKLAGRAFVLLAGCSLLIVSSFGSVRALEKTFSGFLSDYSQLKPSPEFDGALSYQNPARNLKEYAKFMLDPVLVHFAPNARGGAIDPEKLDQLIDFFEEELAKALSKKYQVVDEPGSGVLRLRAAITDVQLTWPTYQIDPKSKTLVIGLGGASMEGEAIDSQTGERVLAVVDSRRGRRLTIEEGMDELGHAKQVMQYWIRRFIKRLDRAHGFMK
jgi:hypothetical protein